MRKVTFGGANSLDNYIARPDDAVDWLKWGPEAAAVMAEYWKTIDTIVMGRKTYEVAVRQSKSSDIYPGMQSFVFSRRLEPGPRHGVTVVASDPASFVDALRRRQGKDICLMGGGNLAKTLFEADLIDEVGFNIHPVLLGSGVPLFYPMSRQIDLQLLEATKFKNGCVFVRYRVTR